MTEVNVRIDFALIPSEPQASAIIDASQHISHQLENRNVIDRVNFPPHVSLHIATVPAAKITELIQLIKNAASQLNIRPMLIPDELVEGSSGYISLNLAITPDLSILHRAVIEATATVRKDGDPDLSPHIARYASDEQERYRKYGSIYVLERFDAHFSVAKVDWEDQSEAFTIANKYLAKTPPCPAAELLLCDIGPHNEKWEILFSV